MDLVAASYQLLHTAVSRLPVWQLTGLYRIQPDNLDIRASAGLLLHDQLVGDLYFYDAMAMGVSAELTIHLDYSNPQLAELLVRWLLEVQPGLERSISS